MAKKKAKITEHELDDDLDLEEAGELEKLFAVMEPANRPRPGNQSQRKSQWRSVEEYMEARRLQNELIDEYELDDEE